MSKKMTYTLQLPVVEPGEKLYLRLVLGDTSATPLVIDGKDEVLGVLSAVLADDWQDRCACGKPEGHDHAE